MNGAQTSPENECFFIAPIGDEQSEIRRRSDLVLKYIVQPAVAELGLTAIRGDELAIPGQITLHVIDHILHARAVVADLTGRNANVFYELAVRHATKLPVALIVANDDPPLPFDIAQMNVIRFDHTNLESADLCRQALVAHLQAGFNGAVDSPIALMVELIAARSIDRRLEEFLEEVVQRFQAQATASSRMVLEEILNKSNLPAEIKADTAQGIGSAIEEAVGRVVEETKEDAFIEIDATPLLGRFVQPFLISYDNDRLVANFLNEIWYRLKDHTPLPAHKYGEAWVLQDAEAGTALYEMGRAWAKRETGRGLDYRPMEMAGLRRGMRLRAIRVPPFKGEGGSK
jgi:hypothetical protein